MAHGFGTIVLLKRKTSEKEDIYTQLHLASVWLLQLLADFESFVFTPYLGNS